MQEYGVRCPVCCKTVMVDIPDCSVCASKSLEVQSNSAQQLKAEILPLLDEAIGDLKLVHVENAAHWLNQIAAKLSAV